VRHRAAKSTRLEVTLLEMPRKTRTKAHSTNILDYPSNLSMYEKESLASEARIAADRKKDKLERLNSHDDKSISEQLRRESDQLLADAAKLIKHAEVLKEKAAELQKQLSRLERSVKQGKKT
jgi:hypothetical protein